MRIAAAHARPLCASPALLSPRSERLRLEKRQQEQRERELQELDRDTRTVFAFNVSTKADERDLFEFFTAAGTVLDVRIIYDRNTPRSKGMAYVEMKTREDASKALALSGTPLKNQVVMVKHSEAEKNIAWEAEKAAKSAGGAQLLMSTAGASGVEGGGPARLRVSNLHPNLTEKDVRDLFDPFGPLQACALLANAVGEAEVVYTQTAPALLALQQLNGMDLAGMPMRVSLAPGTMLASEPAPGMMQVSAGELDEDGDGGLKLDSRSRAALMARLAGQSAPSLPTAIHPVTGLPMAPGASLSGAPSAVPAGADPTAQGRLGPASPIPTECLLLKNMFDPAQETEPDWWLDIGQDVKEECAKYGPVTHVFVDKDSAGFVYLRFTSTAAAAAARGALHTRWFAGRMIAADFQFTAVYQREFPEAA